MIGSNEKATRFSGIDTRRVILKVYLVSSLLAAVAAVVMMARFNSANASYGESYLLVTILAAVLGGIDPMGGFGKVSGLSCRSIMLQVISSAFNLLELQPVPDARDLGRHPDRVTARAAYPPTGALNLASGTMASGASVVAALDIGKTNLKVLVATPDGAPVEASRVRTVLRAAAVSVDRYRRHRRLVPRHSLRVGATAPHRRHRRPRMAAAACWSTPTARSCR